MAIKDDAMIVAGVALAALAVAWYVKGKAGAVAAAVGPLVNPLDERNLAYTSTNSFLGLLAGDKNFNLGYAAYDATHGGALDGTSVNNLAYRSMNGAWAIVTGKENFDLGSEIYDGVQAVKGWFQ